MDTTSTVLTLLSGAVTGGGMSLIGAYLQRPKTKAEARQTSVATELSVSADAREWVNQFMQRTLAAEKRAESAERKADAAERRADRAERKVDLLEQALREHDIPIPPEDA